MEVRSANSSRPITRSQTLPRKAPPPPSGSSRRPPLRTGSLPVPIETGGSIVGDAVPLQRRSQSWPGASANESTSDSESGSSSYESAGDTQPRVRLFSEYTPVWPLVIFLLLLASATIIHILEPAPVATTDIAPPCHVISNPTFIGPRGQRTGVTSLLRPMPRVLPDLLRGSFITYFEIPIIPDRDFDSVIGKIVLIRHIRAQLHSRWSNDVQFLLNQDWSDAMSGFWLNDYVPHMILSNEMNCTQWPLQLACPLHFLWYLGMAIQRVYGEALSKVHDSLYHRVPSKLDRWEAQIRETQSELQSLQQQLHLLLHEIAVTESRSWFNKRRRLDMLPTLRYLRQIETDALMLNGALYAANRQSKAVRNFLPVFERYLASSIADTLGLPATFNFSRIIEALNTPGSLQHISRRRAAQLFWKLKERQQFLWQTLFSRFSLDVTNEAVWEWTLDHFEHTILGDPRWRNLTRDDAFFPVSSTSIGCSTHPLPLLRWWFDEWTQGAEMLPDTPQWPEIFHSLDPTKLDRREKRRCYGIRPDGTFGRTLLPEWTVFCADRR